MSQPPTSIDIFDGDEELAAAFDRWFAQSHMTKLPPVQEVAFMFPAVFAAGWRAAKEQEPPK